MAQKLTLTKTIKFPVTQEDIDKSICGNRRQCMIATAFKNVYLDDKDHGYLTVDENGIAVTLHGVRSIYSLTKPTKKRAKIFDDNKALAVPFIVNATLTLEKPVRREWTKEKATRQAAVRRARDAERREQGLPPVRYNRFV